MKSTIFNNLSGKILIASPYMISSGMFYKSVIYVLTHTVNGSVGLIVNYPINHLTFKNIHSALRTDSILQDEDANNILPIHLGGPIEPEKAFMLHSCDYDKNLLFEFQDGLAISSNVEIFKDLIVGKGPLNSLFVLGYTVWTKNELEQELTNNLWIISDVDQEIIFRENDEHKWNRALEKLGMSNSHFASTSGHC